MEVTQRTPLEERIRRMKGVVEIKESAPEEEVLSASYCSSGLDSQFAIPVIEQSLDGAMGTNSTIPKDGKVKVKIPVYKVTMNGEHPLFGWLISPLSRAGINTQFIIPSGTAPPFYEGIYDGRMVRLYFTNQNSRR